MFKSLRLLCVLPIITVTPENLWIVETAVVTVVGVVLVGLFVTIKVPEMITDPSLEGEIASWEKHIAFCESFHKFMKRIFGEELELKNVIEAIALAERQLQKAKIRLENVKMLEAKLESLLERQRLRNQEETESQNDSDSDAETEFESDLPPDPDESAFLPGDFFMSIYKIFVKDKVEPLTAERLHTDLQSFNGDLTAIISYINQIIEQKIPLTPEAITYIEQLRKTEFLIKGYINIILETPFIAPEVVNHNINLLIENFHFFIS